ncbi:threonine aldolase family protein [Halobellus ruber]|uniref:Aminotransferase class I/II-fold pyridoxal phosphate-dependent enzyme n=1 Tax=Halobellus ruber TaxID=2761102 RepID=A0A7J9SCW5_9EURY|nr:GntG family PLP-dependent aldolase [Halobellus ruber]MBB6644755.1 aminotransferase class I/II-fold pyridoxal phosphate-dependent enzyme [Halobellus ruber]
MAIDLRSDTVTQPSERMRTAAAEAAVGDDVYGEDPTVNDLEAAAADRVGTEDALYVPTGTMGNQIAARVHTDRGQEVVLDREAHIYQWELAGLAQLSGVQPRTVDADDAVPTPEQIHGAYVKESLHRPGTGLVTLENTHNARGGVAVPPEPISAAAEAAHDHDLPVHLDGARLFNACVALDVDPARMVRDVDSVLFCLSKGLGAPVGSMLAGDAKFIAAARRIRKLFGGGMRQAGLVAAPGLLAFENVERLATDHDNAARLAAGLGAIDGLRVPEPDTNIVRVYTDDLADAETFVEACEAAGVRGGVHGPHLTRFCTHLDVDRDDVETAIDRVAGVVASL